VGAGVDAAEGAGGDSGGDGAGGAGRVSEGEPGDSGPGRVGAPLFRDEQFVDLFPARGKPAWSPGRLTLVLVLQFVEGLTDQQAAEAALTPWRREPVVRAFDQRTRKELGVPARAGKVGWIEPSSVRQGRVWNPREPDPEPLPAASLCPQECS
jgi:hypothetical protein